MRSKYQPVVNPRVIAFFTGVELLFIAAMMLLPSLISLYYKDGDFAALALSLVINGVTGGLLTLIGRRHREINLREGFAVVAVGWVVMAAAGALPFILSGVISRPVDAFFESMSGFTTTGASILGGSRPIENLPHGVLFWRSLTHWIGGMGIILLSLAILPLLGVGGMQLFKAEVPGPTKDKLTPRIRDTAEILWGVYVIFSAAQTILLKIAGMSWFDAACHTFGTMATGGFSTKDLSVGAYQNPWIDYIIILFMLIAGVNFALHFHLLRGRFKPLKSNVEFKFFLITAATATVILIVINAAEQPSLPLESLIRASLFHTASILTTTGYGTVDWEQWSVAAQSLMILLMMIGGMAGSTAGGIKVVRVQVAIRQIGLEFRRLIHPQALLPLRIGEQVVAEDVVRNVITFILAFMILLGAGTAILTAMNIDLVTAFGASIACLSNIGPGLGEVGPADNYGWMPDGAKWVLATMMMLGRLELFTVMILFTRHFWRR